MHRLSASLWCVIALAHGTWTAAPALAVDYQRQVRPILSAACFQCHGPDAATRQAELRLDRADGGALQDRGGKRIIVPGRPDKSELLRRLTAADADVKMPPADHPRQLSKAEIDLIRRWIAEGAQWETHWAFAPPAAKTPSGLNDPSAWARNGIDRFVLQQLQQEQLTPTPEADKTTLIRRVTLDLTGLPPTLEEVDAFLADDSPDAYERVVDRLLASPRFGERMAVDWLDAARYADTNGYQVDRDRDMWPWRDWVVRAYNDNMPFDQFTLEQLAGDLLPHPTQDQRIATGFHRNHMLNEEGGIIPEEFLAEYVADRVETTATVWLGLTMGCARCHDHKYDPLSQKDFYGLFAFFHNVPERGVGNFGVRPNQSAPPLLPLPTAEQQAQLDQVAAATKAVEEKLAAPDADLTAEQAVWENAVITAAPAEWVQLVPTQLKSDAGATLTIQADQSILVRGTNPVRDTYTLTFTAPLQNLTALRLEALPDESLAARGPGRAPNGNFVLSGLELTVAGTPVEFQAAWASFSQDGFPAAHVVDAQPATGWAVHPQFGRPHTATFVVDRPLDVAENAPLTVVLKFASPHAQHQLGRFRLSAANGSGVYDRSQLPLPVAEALSVSSATRTDAQKSTLRDYYRQNVSLSMSRWNDELARLRKQRTDLEAQVTTMMVMQELATPRPTHILERGQYDAKGEQVTASTPDVLPAFPASLPRNRLGLARWLTDPSNPLTARVTVNRYWQTYFGNGLVRTAGDFGAQGEPPSHPELLDWLATEFVRSGWNVKHMQRLIVTSATYRQSSHVTPAFQARDPENRLLARGPRVRLPAETIRDQALAISGMLVERCGGPPVRPYQPAGLYEQVVYQGGNSYRQSHGPDLYRRSLYTYWKRSVPHPAMLLFDVPFRENCTVQRSRTSTPLQALNLLNDPTYVEAARLFAGRMLKEGGETPEQRITYGFRLALARSPQPNELAILTSACAEMLADFRGDRAAAAELLKIGETPSDHAFDTAELAAYLTVASTLLNLDQTITKE